jgi:hypothetical protein
MDEWKKVVEWAAREEAEEKRVAHEHFKRTLAAWPMIAVAVIPFAWLAFRSAVETRAYSTVRPGPLLLSARASSAESLSTGG